MLKILPIEKTRFKILLDNELIINNIKEIINKYENMDNKHNYIENEFCLVEIFNYYSSYMTVHLFSMKGLHEIDDGMKGFLLEHYKVNISDEPGDEDWQLILENLIFDLINIIKPIWPDDYPDLCFACHDSKDMYSMRNEKWINIYPW